jgi:hypothetical protein
MVSIAVLQGFAGAFIQVGAEAGEGLQLLELGVIPDCSQRVAQAFQPVQAQAKACGYRK